MYDDWKYFFVYILQSFISTFTFVNISTRLCLLLSFCYLLCLFTYSSYFKYICTFHSGGKGCRYHPSIIKPLILHTGSQAAGITGLQFRSSVLWICLRFVRPGSAIRSVSRRRGNGEALKHQKGFLLTPSPLLC